jgi:uncharacterized protein (TIGR02145 family)
MKTMTALCLIMSASFAQNITMSGRVTDFTGGAPIAGAAVHLEHCGLSATTGLNGDFTLSGTISKNARNATSRNTPDAWTVNGLVYLFLYERSPVTIEAFTLQGKMVWRVIRIMEPGLRNITVSPAISGVRLYRINSSAGEWMLKTLPSYCRMRGTASATPRNSSIAQTIGAKTHLLFNDVLTATKDGYLTYRTTVSNPDTSGLAMQMIICADTVLDADGNLYHAVRIGSQVWTVENLRTNRYNDGTKISFDTSTDNWAQATAEKYCFYANRNDTSEIGKFGILYNWYTVKTGKLAPAGWHVPSGAEWDTLQNFLISNGYNWDGTTTYNKVAKSLAARTDWNAFNNPGTIGNDIPTNNKTGFSALPAGFRGHHGYFLNLNLAGYWWSTTETDESTAVIGALYYFDANLYKESFSKKCGNSVRLLRDF